MKVLCSCVYPYQDQRYGKQVRIATPVNKSKSPLTKKLEKVRCTVCGKEHSYNKGDQS